MADHHLLMAGKRVLVTGAGTGIGLGIAQQMASEGAQIVLHYAHSGEEAQEAVAGIKDRGGRAKEIQADFRQIDCVASLAQEATEFLGGCDLLINNAGITNNVPFEEVTLQQFETLINVNLRAQFFLTQAMLPALIQSKPSAVINITSVHAFAGMTEHTVYAATKSAIVGYTRVLALELIQKGVRVNAIAPGWVRVKNQEEALGNEFDWAEAGRSVPAGFCAEPRDIAQLAIYLASEKARFIVGQTIVADGGQLNIMPLTGDFRERRETTFGTKYM